ncbi:hypothetical protein [Paenisporosarcina sp. NPDC076898]|uniref:hypothetical protein n=1 Tax=unclassified Paenisporosarcina TaxID=2642018 RepID=UPI003CFFF15E
MQEIKLAKWVLEVDVEQTREFYSKDFEICGCLNCTNFFESIKNVEPSVADVFENLGIDPLKPGHLSDFRAMEEGKHEYIGSYHFIGKVLNGDLCNKENWNASNTVQLKNFTIGFSNDLDFVPEDFPYPLVQMEFVALMSWVLQDETEKLN